MFSNVGRDAVDERTLDLADVLLEEAVAEDAQRLRIGLELLHDQVVVLAGLDVAAVLADRVADLLEAGLIDVLQRLDPAEGLAAGFHDQLHERVARAGGRRRTQHLDLVGRQASC